MGNGLVVLNIYDTGVANMVLEAPAPTAFALPRDPRQRWRKAHRLSREVGHRGLVCVRRHRTFAGEG